MASEIEKDKTGDEGTLQKDEETPLLDENGLPISRDGLNVANNTFDSSTPGNPANGAPQLQVVPSTDATGGVRQKGPPSPRKSNVSSIVSSKVSRSPAPTSLGTTESGTTMTTAEAKKRFEQCVRKVEQFGGQIVDEDLPNSAKFVAAVRFVDYYDRLHRAEQRLFHMLRQQKKSASYVPLKAAAIYQGYEAVYSKAVELKRQADSLDSGVTLSLTPRTQRVLKVADERNAAKASENEANQQSRDAQQPLAPGSQRPNGGNPNLLAVPSLPGLVNRSRQRNTAATQQPSNTLETIPVSTGDPNRSCRQSVLVDPNSSYYTKLPPPWNVVPDIPAKESDVMRLVDSQSSRAQFSGNHVDYAAWRRKFIDLVHRKGIPAGQKAVALESCLDTSALVLKGFCKLLAANPEAYMVVIEKLERAYGGEERVVKSCLKMVSDLPRLVEGDFVQLSYADATLTEVYALLASFNRTHEMDAMGVHDELISKMDKGLRLQYFRHCTFNHLRQTTAVLASWLTSELESVQRDLTLSQNLGPKAPQTRAAAYTTQTQEAPSETPSSNTVLATEQQCPLCQTNHLLRDCPLYDSMSAGERRSFIQKQGRCYRCLRTGHGIRQCRSTLKCRIPGCTRDHHTSLHRFNPKGTAVEKAVAHLTLTDATLVAPAECFSDDDDLCPPDAEQGVEATAHCTDTTTRSIALPYTAVRIRSSSGASSLGYALLDSCATASFISHTLASALHLVGKPTQLHLHTANGTKVLESYKVAVDLVTPQARHTVLAYVVDKPFIRGSLPVWDSTTLDSFNHLKGVQVNQHGLDVPRKPSLLLGADHLHLFHPDETRSPESGAVDVPRAFHCILGWVVYGPTDPASVPELNIVEAHATSTGLRPIGRGPPLSPSLDEFHCREDPWRLEDGAPVPTIAEQYALQKLREGWQLDVNGQLTLPVLWRPGEPSFPRSNYPLARSRLINNEKKAAWNTAEVKEAYRKIIAEYLEKDYAREVSQSERGLGKYYLAHFPVIRPDHESTKVRIVMDARAKHDGKSLNDAILPGPSLIGDLVLVLLRFRQHAVAISGDVSQMFLRVRMPPADRPYHRWLYRESPTAVTREFEMRSHVFGNSGSPCVAMFAAQENARHHFGTMDEYRGAVEAICTSTIMDDTLCSTPDTASAIDLAQKLRTVYAKISMTIHKFASNDAAVMASLPEHCRSKLCSKALAWDEGLTALGMRWDATSDCLGYTIAPLSKVEVLTKRELLRTYMKLFDPLGVALPFIMTARLLFRRSWNEAATWDEPLPCEMVNSWNNWTRSCNQLRRFTAPRHLGVGEGARIHVFADASQEAYAACAYVVSTDHKCSLALARGKVAPIRMQQSIPRLELEACKLAVIVACTVATAFKLDAKTFTYWTDSKDVLWWLRQMSTPLKPFVANRVSHIHKHTCLTQWRWTPSASNPADIASRGCHMPLPPLWLQGPEFLTWPATQWPTLSEFETPSEQAQMEVRKQYLEKLQHSAICHTVDYIAGSAPIDLSRTNNLTRLLGGLARLPCFEDVNSLADRKRRCLRFLIRMTQWQAYEKEITTLQRGHPVGATSTLADLTPYLDDQGLLRVHRRLQGTALGEPLILPPKSHLVRLLLLQIHADVGHHSMGPEQVVALFRENYHARQARAVAKVIHRSCVQCRRLHGRVQTQIMAPLPVSRVPSGKLDRAFRHASLDVGGPYFVRGKELTGQRKRWFCLFTCLQTRACHLEDISSLDADTFLSALSRFTSRRGTPESIYMDNQRAFVAAARELASLKGGHEYIDFIFAPPHAPHFNGVSERLVQSVKRALKGLLSSGFTSEDYRTALVIAEGLINSRPLTYLSDSVDDPNPLTPAHFLGQAAYRDPLTYPSETGHKKRWLNLQSRLSKFWRRLLKEFTLPKNPQSKWSRPKPGLCKGDVVLFYEPLPTKPPAAPTSGRGRPRKVANNPNLDARALDRNKPIQHDRERGVWPLGCVEGTHTSRDGLVRQVDIRAGDGRLIRRPISKTVFLCRSHETDTPKKAS